VGLRLKLAQRDWVRAQGVTNWITWTYDPLYRANGIFNIHRLGAVCSTYIRDLYGEMTDVLNAGGPSDRFQVDWWINSKRVQTAMQRVSLSAQEDRAAQAGNTAGGNAHTQQVAASYPGLCLLPTGGSGTARRPGDLRPRWDGAPVAMPIPEDIAALRRQDRALALEWRYYVRDLMEEAFAAGYSVVDCVHTHGGDWCYILAPATADL
jgi:predicted GNAT superfamily acetyltransferase